MTSNDGYDIVRPLPPTVFIFWHASEQYACKRDKQHLASDACCWGKVDAQNHKGAKSRKDTRLVSTAYICHVSLADVYPVSAEDICPVLTEDACPVSTEDLCLGSAADTSPVAAINACPGGIHVCC